MSEPQKCYQHRCGSNQSDFTGVVMDDRHSIPVKVCTHCAVAKSATLEFFPVHKMGKHGVHSLCRPCKKLDDEKRRKRPDQMARQQAWRDANKETVKQSNAEYRQAGYSSTAAVAAWRAKNIDHARKLERERMARYRRADPEKHRAAGRAYTEKNRAAINARATAASMEKYRNNPWFNLKSKIGSRLRKMVVGKAGRKTEAILGYNRMELLVHIEKQFTKGMTWQKMLSGEIHLDHIIPVAAFRCESIDDPAFKACWALSNLRPMWAVDNLRKQAKVLSLL